MLKWKKRGYKKKNVYQRDLFLIFSCFLDLELLDGFEEGLTLDFVDLQFQSGWRSGTVSTGDGTGTPWGTTVDFFQVSQFWEGVLVTQWDEDDTVVSQGGQGVDDGSFVTTTGTGGDESTSDLTV